MAKAESGRKLRPVASADAPPREKKARKPREPVDITKSIRAARTACVTRLDKAREREGQLEASLLHTRVEREGLEAQLRRLNLALGEVPELPGMPESIVEAIEPEHIHYERADQSAGEAVQS